jgi:hypothetical protein
VHFGINLPPSFSYSSLTYQNLHQTGHIQEYYVKCHIKCRYNTFFQISCLDILILHPLVFPCDHRICLNIHLILSAGLLFVHLGSGKELFRGRGIMASGILYLQARNDNVLKLSIWLFGKQGRKLSTSSLRTSASNTIANLDLNQRLTNYELRSIH